MHVLLSWLKEFIPFEHSIEEITDMLNMSGLEVEGVEEITPSFKGVVVAEVRSVNKHPEAEKLVVTEVFDGKETFQVVCGAPNVRPGMKGAFAKVGAVLTDENDKSFKIKKAKLRGIESYGMLLSEAELKLSDDHEGIIELDKTYTVGQDLSLCYTDTVFNISLTPNLGHCQNLLGIARELRAKIDQKVHFPEVNVQENANDPIEKKAKVQVQDTENCPRYTCRLIKGVEIKPSPDWLKGRLLASNIRPVNIIADITNYVMLELGQPLHAFDFNKIDGSIVQVRRSHKDEEIITLDGKTRKLHSEDLVIADQNKPIAIAGIMGGSNSEVTDETQDILLESAYFDPVSIRRSSKRFNLATEASRRFERSTDPNMVIFALDRATTLIQDLAGGKASLGIIDIKAKSFDKKIIDCRLDKINSLLGTQISVSEIETLFDRIDLKSKWNGKDTFQVTVPTYRADIVYEVDLIEEVARLFGYENLKKGTVSYSPSNTNNTPAFVFERKIRERLVAEGMQEFLTSDLIGPKLLEIVQGPIMGDKAMVQVLNPTSIEQSFLRTSLFPGLLQVVKYNYDRQNHHICGFELGRVHFKEEDRYREETEIGIIMMGTRNPEHWESKAKAYDYYDMKGIVENLLDWFGIKGCQFKNTKISLFHDFRQASCFIDTIEIGSFGEVHPAIIRRLDVPERIYFGEFNMADIYRLRKQTKRMQPISLYPSSTRDWTLTASLEMAYEEIETLINQVKPALLDDFYLVDVYKSKDIGEGKKNITIRFVYHNREKTISQEAVEAAHEKMKEQVAVNLGS